VRDPAAPAALLEALARALPPDVIDELWIFPPRRVGGAPSSVVVASAYERPQAGPAATTDEHRAGSGAQPAGAAGTPDSADAGAPLPAAATPDATMPPATPPVAAPADEVPSDRRRILTARFTLERDARGQPALCHELAEHGAAPADRVARVVNGVIRRLDDEPAPPRHARIGGDSARWAALLAALVREDAG
jgi:hypothetical protein